VPETLWANASPQKRLFISLITRDITLADAILDLIDNSINAAIVPMADRLQTADNYQQLFTSRTKPQVHIEIKVGSAKISVADDASGIDLETALHDMFKFGTEDGHQDSSDRLSVYGIGLKRAIFKCGNRIRIVSDHRKGGFELYLPDVKRWARTPEKNDLWELPITARPPAEKLECGTIVTITELHDEVLRRIDNGLFLPQLRERIARTYSFFIGRIVEISLNGSQIEADRFEIGDNYESKRFKSGKVTCNVTAGIAITTGGTFRQRNSGWYVFCNGRAVIFANTGTLTGWGAGLPIFQAKHRPFIGTVFFVSTDPEQLPWTTTKSSVNEDNPIWQEALSHMIAVGRIVIRFLDERYSELGTEVAPQDLQGAAGTRTTVLRAAVTKQGTFTQPSASKPKTVRIQYEAKVADVKRIEAHRKEKMGGSEVGRFTFNWYLKNEVGGGG
jgi:hypothetical protein